MADPLLNAGVMLAGFVFERRRQIGGRSCPSCWIVSLCLTLLFFCCGGGKAETVNLAWDANTDGITTGYFVYTTDAGNQVLSKQNVGNATTASVPNLVPATTYKFYVTAYSLDLIESLPSNTVTHTTSSAPAPQNTPPVASSFSVTTQEDGSTNITLSSSDAEGAALQYILERSPARGTLSGTAPNLIYRPALNFNGSDSLTYRVSDGVLESSVATVTIVVTPVNDPPTISNLSYSTQQGAPLQITFAGVDPDGDALTYSLGTGPARGALSGSGATRTYTPAAGYSGSDSFTYRASDGTANSGLATVSIQITAAPNSPPVANALLVQTDERQPRSLVLVGSDSDGDSLTFSISVPPQYGTLTGSPPNLTYTPNAGFVGSDEFKYVASDGKAYSSAATVSISVVSSGGRIKFRRFSHSAQ